MFLLHVSFGSGLFRLIRNWKTRNSSVKFGIQLTE